MEISRSMLVCDIFVAKNYRYSSIVSKYGSGNGSMGFCIIGV